MCSLSVEENKEGRAQEEMKGLRENASLASVNLTEKLMTCSRLNH